MYRKNTASQFIHFQGVDSTTGGIKSGVTWTIRRCIDGTFAAGGGTVTEDGSTGFYKCALSQADTNGNNIGFNFTGTGAVPQTVNIVTDGSPPDVNLSTIKTQAVTCSAGVTVGAFVGNATAAIAATAAGGVTLGDGVAHGGTLGSSTATLALSRLNITSQTSNTVAITATGNGTGNGATFTGGASDGKGMAITAGATNADGLRVTGTGTGHGFNAQSGGGATGNGINAASNATNGDAMALTGAGTGHGINATSGSGATGNGIKATSAATNGHGFSGTGVGTGDGMNLVGGGSAGGDGLACVAGGGVDIRGAITGNITGTLSTVTTLTNLPAITANWLTAAGTAADFGAEVADAVWDEALSGHTTAGSAGKALSDAGTAGDPWTTPLPGAYSSGTAGFIVGTNLDTTVSSRASPTNITAGTITTVTNLTNLPTIPANWLTAAGTAADFGAEVADAILDRNMATGSDSGSSTVRTPRQALRVLRNKVDLATTPGAMDVKKEDDSTSSWTATLTTNASADPITIIDPAGP